MKPYYEQDGITIYHGDCRDILPQFPDKSFDLVLTDPPYGLNSKMTGGTWGRAYRDSDMMRWDYVLQTEDILKVISFGKVQIVWGGNNYALPASRCWLVWSKPEIPTLSDVELAWTNLDAPSKLFREIRQAHNGHPTAKPLSLMKWSATFAEGTILDPFMGSGTTLVAAKQLGRKAVGIEIEEKYCEIAVKRLAQMEMKFV